MDKLGHEVDLEDQKIGTGEERRFTVLTKTKRIFLEMRVLKCSVHRKQSEKHMN